MVEITHEGKRYELDGDLITISEIFPYFSSTTITLSKHELQIALDLCNKHRKELGLK